MLFILRIILSAITLSLSVYCFVTERFEYMPLMMLSLGAMLFVSGLHELSKNKKAIWGYFSIAVSVFVVFSTIERFINR
ncbi:DUF3953 domain-containing protein [Cytobacillus depressus]|uniref:DUF3953 domain-containing protein n=1 Tax=Cytobacillus depressus TaxID=1602942 RepID=A0A6L3V5G1_9BACI|nr:DUF3953 domain-containing protein [Cytobacillus depressus]